MTTDDTGSQPRDTSDDAELERPTLDPPGTIAVVGAGPLGIEAALYGRFLGYNVTLFERSGIGSSLVERSDDPLPLPSDRCWSPLAAAALEAQFPERFPGKGPETVGQWREMVLVALSETDLLRGRVHVPARVTRIELVEVSEASGEGEPDDDGPVPPDFRLTVEDGAGAAQDGAGAASTADFEAVILAIGGAEPPELAFELPTAYFFRLGAGSESVGERHLLTGLQEIVALYAELAGRETLDLYRPLRR